jgi:hypothetical protein
LRNQDGRKAPPAALHALTWPAQLAVGAAATTGSSLQGQTEALLAGTPSGPWTLLIASARTPRLRRRSRAASSASGHGWRASGAQGHTGGWGMAADSACMHMSLRLGEWPQIAHACTCRCGWGIDHRSRVHAHVAAAGGWPQIAHACMCACMQARVGAAALGPSLCMRIA